MLTIQNLDKINGIPVLNDTWMLYLTVSTSFKWYSFLVLKNHSSIEAYPHYEVQIFRSKPNRVVVRHLPVMGNSKTIHDNPVSLTELTDKTAFINLIETIIT